MPAPRDHDETREVPRLRPARATGAGPTLADALRGQKLPPLPWAVWLGKQAADQLDQAHRHGVVHGRVSLAAFTIVDTPLGEEVVLDVDPAAPRSPTPLGPFAVASDLWALGEVLYHLLTGAAPPFDPLGERVPGPTRDDRVSVPSLVSEVVLRLLDHAPQARPGAGEVAFALARAERELATMRAHGLCWMRGSLVFERYRLLREPGDRPSFAAADLHDLAPRRLTRVEPGNRACEVALEKEWGLLRAIEDPHVERLLEVMRSDDGSLVAVTTAPDGALLSSLVQDGARPPLAEARRLLAGVARGLAALHAAGATAAGLELDDVVLTGDRPTRAVIVDLCHPIAERIDSRLNPQLVRAGTVRTSFAPEALQGGRGDARSDLYDLGRIAHRLLAGREPFDGKSMIDQLKAHLLKTPPRLTDVPADLADLVVALLEKDPARRPASAAAVALALEARG